MRLIEEERQSGEKNSNRSYTIIIAMHA